MRWLLFIGGALIAVSSGMLTLSPNGGTLLGLVICFAGVWLMIKEYDDGE